MMYLIWLMLGGAMGTLGRYLITLLSIKFWGLQFPFGTLIVNAVGSLMIGFIWGMWDAKDLKPEIKAFLIMGVLGGFTTFSAYSVETLSLFKAGQIKLALVNILANNLLSLVMVFLGYVIGKWCSSSTTGK
nr:fluoride efflux transporter CrcB [Saprospiraceae bacterium]